MTDEMQVDLLVVGATAAGFALAHQHPNNSVVIERTSLIGQEFIDSLNPGCGWENQPTSELAVDVAAELRRRNIVSDAGTVHIPALAPVLFRRVHQAGLPFRFMTEFVAAEAADQGFTVTVYDQAGFHTIGARSIVDTTAGRQTRPAGCPMKGKGLHALLDPADDTAAFPVCSDQRVDFLQGRFPQEVILRLTLDPDDDWPTARAALIDFWRSRPPELAAWRIGAIASTFAVAAAPGPIELAPNWVWLPSCAYDNALQAMDHGVQWGEGMSI